LNNYDFAIICGQFFFDKFEFFYFYKNQNDRNLETSVGSDPRVGGGIGVSGVSSWVAVGGAL